MIRVLLADDHPVVRSGYRRLLEQAGDIKIVGEAGDGHAAYALFVALMNDAADRPDAHPSRSRLSRLAIADAQRTVPPVPRRRRRDRRQWGPCAGAVARNRGGDRLDPGPRRQ